MSAEEAQEAGQLELGALSSPLSSLKTDFPFGKLGGHCLNSVPLFPTET